MSDDDADNDIDDKLHPRKSKASKQKKTVALSAAAAAEDAEFDERAMRERANEARRRKRDFRIGDDDNGDDGDVIEAAGVRAARVHRDNVTGKRVIDAVAGEQLPGLADGDDDDDDDNNNNNTSKAYVIDGQEVAIEPFHLERERRHGYFDEDGHYIENGFGKEDTEEDAAGMPVVKKARKGRKKRAGDNSDDDDDDGNAKASGSDDSDVATKDAWFSEVEAWGKEGGSGKMQAAAKAHAAQLARMAAADAAPPEDPEQSARALVSLLHNDDDETVRAAMQRLRAPKRDRKAPPLSAEQQRDAKENLALLDKLTQHTSVLVNAGFPDAYDAGKEEIENWLAQHRKAKQRSAESGGSSNKAAADDMVWHYRVSISAREIHGPFTTAQMKPWYEAGYFASPDVLVRVRHRDDERTGFQPADRVDWAKWFGAQQQR